MSIAPSIGANFSFMCSDFYCWAIDLAVSNLSWSPRRCAGISRPWLRVRRGRILPCHGALCPQGRETEARRQPGWGAHGRPEPGDVSGNHFGESQGGVKG